MENQNGSEKDVRRFTNRRVSAWGADHDIENRVGASRVGKRESEGGCSGDGGGVEEKRETTTKKTKSTWRHPNGRWLQSSAPLTHATYRVPPQPAWGPWVWCSGDSASAALSKEHRNTMGVRRNPRGRPDQHRVPGPYNLLERLAILTWSPELWKLLFHPPLA